MAASVRVEDDAFKDERFEVLARLAGLADADHARGKMLRIWRQCTMQGVHVLPFAILIGILGEIGPTSIVSSGLGEEVDGGIRIAGTSGRIEWLEKLRKNGRKGGKAKAKQMASNSLANAIAPLEQKPSKHLARQEQEQEQEFLLSHPQVFSGFLSPELPDQGGPPVDRVQAGPESGSEVRPKKNRPRAVPQEALAAAERLLAGILGNNPAHKLAVAAESKRRDTVELWADDLRKLHEIDRQPWVEIESVIDWVQTPRGNPGFEWWTVIQSGANLRDKWDKITAQIRARSASVTPAKDARFGRGRVASAEEYEREAAEAAEENPLDRERRLRTEAAAAASNGVSQ